MVSVDRFGCPFFVLHAAFVPCVKVLGLILFEFFFLFFGSVLRGAMLRTSVGALPMGYYCKQLAGSMVNLGARQRTQPQRMRSPT